jgi:hypothetical protein
MLTHSSNFHADQNNHNLSSHNDLIVPALSPYLRTGHSIYFVGAGTLAVSNSFTRLACSSSLSFPHSLSRLSLVITRQVEHAPTITSGTTPPISSMHAPVSGHLGAFDDAIRDAVAKSVSDVNYHAHGAW